MSHRPIPLSDVQLKKIAAVQEEIADAQEDFLKAQKTYQAAVKKRTDIFEVILDAVGAPTTSQFDLQNGVILVPEEEKEESPKVPDDVDGNGVSASARVDRPEDDKPVNDQ